MSRLVRQDAPGACYRFEPDDEDLESIGRLELLRMLNMIYLVREFEVRLLELKDEDLVHGPVHASIGQEAVAAGVASALCRRDLVSSTHRAHGHFLCKALAYYAPDAYDPLRDGLTIEMQGAIDRTLAEIMGLREGWCGGRGGSMHLYDATSGNIGSNAIVGGGIPVATGVAWASRLKGDDAVVVSFFGDGAFNQGCFHEVANMASLWEAPVLYLVENNMYAVGTCTLESSCAEDLACRAVGYGFDCLIVDGMDPMSVLLAVRGQVERMRRQPGPSLIEAKTYRFRHHGGGLPGHAFGYRTKEEEDEWQLQDPANAFPNRLIASGLLAQADNERLRMLAENAIDESTRFCTAVADGRRYIPVDNWPDASSAERDVRYEGEVFEGVTFSERVIVLGEEVANLKGGVYGASRGIAEVFPERLVNTPISETGFVGMGGGLAAAGLRPVVEIMYPDFALMASDQLFNQIGKLRHMYGGQVSFPVILRTRAGIGFGYGGQHSMDPSALFSLFSGWRVLAPFDAFDYVGLFNTAMRFQDPVLIIEHGQLYGVPGQVPAGRMDYFVAYGKARTVRPGTDVTVVTYMTGVRDCLLAAKQLETEEGLNAEVIDLRTLDYTGMDYRAIGESLKRTGSLLIVEQAPRSMTLAGRISFEIQSRFFDYLDGPVAAVAGLDVPPPVSRKLEEAVLPSVVSIRQAMARAARRES